MAETFHTLIDRNKRNSLLLMALFVLLIALLATSIGYAIGGHWSAGVLVGGIALVVSLVLAAASFYGGSAAVLRMTRAREVTRQEDPQLLNVVEEMAIAAGLPMPRVYVIDDLSPNAFATGRDPDHAAIAVTEGLRQKLTRDELQGVIAHEMAHIRNFDTRYMMLVAVMVGMIVLMSDMFLRTMRFGMVGGRRSRSRGKGGGGGGIVVLVMMVVALVLAILAPILAKLIQMAVSRQREYLADASAVQLTRYPQGLAGALSKIASDNDPLEIANRGTQHMYVVNPLNPYHEAHGHLLATHPPIRERIGRLLAMAHAADPADE